MQPVPKDLRESLVQLARKGQPESKVSKALRVRLAPQAHKVHPELRVRLGPLVRLESPV